MQDFKKSAAKQRLFNDFSAGRVRVLIGSSETMGTGVNVQQRLKALHHLDVPWLPSQIEQREGRIERQGNQHDEIEILRLRHARLDGRDDVAEQRAQGAVHRRRALAATARIRRLEDVGSQANQFAMAKAIASGDGRLMQKAGLETEIARLERQRAAHIDDQHAIRRRIHNARADQAEAEARMAAIQQDIAQHKSDARRRLPHGGQRPDLHRAQGGRRCRCCPSSGWNGWSRSDRTWTIGRIGGFDLVCEGRLASCSAATSP